MQQSDALQPNTIAEIIRGRRSISRFRPEAPPRETVLEALELALWAPNHHLTEPWHFYLLGPDTKQAIVDLNTRLVQERQGEAAARAKRERWSAIPGWLLLTCDRSSEQQRFLEDYAACCAAAQNLALYLWSAGIGMKWTTGDVTRHPEFFEHTWMDPDSEAVVGLFWYGYPDESPDAQRQPLTSRLVELP